MKKKFKIIDACSGEKLKLGEGQMVVMNDQGLFFMVINFRDYDTWVGPLSDYCKNYDVIWKGEE